MFFFFFRKKILRDKINEKLIFIISSYDGQYAYTKSDESVRSIKIKY